MENVLQQRKDPLPKTVADACRNLVHWKNNDDNRDNRMTDANDDLAFVIINEENKKKNKKKEITCYKCKKTAITPMNVTRRKMSMHHTRKYQVL